MARTSSSASARSKASISSPLHRRREGVQPLGPVQRDREHAVGDLVADLLEAHRGAAAYAARAMTITVNGIDEVTALVGQTIGPSEWREVTQEIIDTFAELSGDDQWIHVDVERAKTESPFGTTIAHGNLTLSMIDGFRHELFESTGFKLGVNYGWNKIRFPAPVPVGGRIRGERRDVSRRRGRRRLVPGRPQVDRRGRGLREALLRGRVGRPRCSPSGRPSRAILGRGAILDRGSRAATADRAQGAAPGAARLPGRLPVPDAKRQGPLRRQGASRSASGWRRTSASPSTRGPADMLDADRATSTSSPPRPRPRRCWPSRTSSSATGRASTSGCATTSRTPTSAISLDEDFPRVYFTRERHRRDRAYFGPFSQRQARARDARPARQGLPVPHLRRRRAGPRVRQPLPRLLHQALPGALRRLHLARRSTARTSTRSSTSCPAATARSSASSSSGCSEAAEAQEFEQAAHVPQPAARRCARCSSASGSRTRRSARSTRSPSRPRSTDANAQVFQVRDGVLADRQSFYLENPRRRDEGEVAEEFVLQYYATSLVDPAAGDRAARARRAPRRSREALERAPRRAGRGAPRRARRQAAHLRAGRAQRAARARPGPAALRAPPRSSASTRSTDCARRSSWSRSRCGSSASTSRTSARRTRSPRWSCSRAARRRSRTTAASRSGDGRPGRLRGDGRGALAADGAVRRAARALAARPGVRRELRRAAGADRDRRRQGPAVERASRRSGSSATRA